jgi:hypothetical protein
MLQTHHSVLDRKQDDQVIVTHAQVPRLVPHVIAEVVGCSSDFVLSWFTAEHKAGTVTICLYQQDLLVGEANHASLGS